MSGESISYEQLYNIGMANLDELDKSLQSEQIDFEMIIDIPANEISSNIDAWDLIFAVVFGGLGTFISTNESLAKFSEGIHASASITPNKSATDTEKMIYALLGHSGDFMDKVQLNEIGSHGKPIRQFVTRSAQNIGANIYEKTARTIPHRLAWGHDIFSFKQDNPFKLMIEQYGFLKGIVQAMKHLIADTFSTQGLPLPGHSWFDYLDSASKDRNRLFDVAKKMTKELGINQSGCAFNLDAFNEMFSIHAQDIGSQGLVFVLTLAYFKARNINDKTRKIQFRLLTYSINFYASTVSGAIQHGGIPHVNWAALSMVIKNFTQLYITSNRETKILQRETERIVDSNIALERKVYATGKLINTFNCSWDYISEYEQERRVALDLIDIFEEVE